MNWASKSRVEYMQCLEGLQTPQPHTQWRILSSSPATAAPRCQLSFVESSTTSCVRLPISLVQIMFKILNVWYSIDNGRDTVHSAVPVHALALNCAPRGTNRWSQVTVHTCRKIRFCPKPAHRNKPSWRTISLTIEWTLLLQLVAVAHVLCDQRCTIPVPLDRS